MQLHTSTTSDAEDSMIFYQKAFVLQANILLSLFVVVDFCQCVVFPLANATKSDQMHWEISTNYKRMPDWEVVNGLDLNFEGQSSGI